MWREGGGEKVGGKEVGEGEKDACGGRGGGGERKKVGGREGGEGEKEREREKGK